MLGSSLSQVSKEIMACPGHDIKLLKTYKAFLVRVSRKGNLKGENSNDIRRREKVYGRKQKQ